MFGSAPGLLECGLPSCPVGEDVQERRDWWQVVGVGGGDALPGVPAGVGGCGKAEGFQEPGLAVAPVIVECLAGPAAGDQDAASGVAEVVGVVGFALAVPGAQAGAWVVRGDAVAQPVRAGR